MGQFPGFPCWVLSIQQSSVLSGHLHESIKHGHRHLSNSGEWDTKNKTGSHHSANSPQEGKGLRDESLAHVPHSSQTTQNQCSPPENTEQCSGQALGLRVSLTLASSGITTWALGSAAVGLAILPDAVGGIWPQLPWQGHEALTDLHLVFPSCLIKGKKQEFRSMNWKSKDLAAPLIYHGLREFTRTLC